MMKAVFAVALLAAGAFAVEGDELLRLEVKGSETPGWTSQEAQASTSPLGESFVRFERKSEEGGSALSASAPVEQGKDYSFSVDFKTDVERSGEHRGSWVFITFSCKDGSVVKGPSLILPKAAVWTKRSVSFKAPEGAVKVNFQIRLQQRKGLMDVRSASLLQEEKAQEERTAADPMEDMTLLAKFSLKRSAGGEAVLVDASGKELKNVSESSKAPLSFILPDEHCENDKLSYVVDFSFVPKDMKDPETLFALGRNIWGPFSVNSATVQTWEDGNVLFSRVLTNNHQAMTTTGPRIFLKPGKEFAGRLVFSSSQLQCFLDGISGEPTSTPGDKFLWPKGKPFFVGAYDQKGSNSFKGEIKSFSVSVMKKSFELSLKDGFSGAFLRGDGKHKLSLAVEGEAPRALSFSVLDMNGKTLAASVPSEAKDGEISLDLPALPLGCHTLLAKNEAGKIKFSRTFAVLPESSERVPAEKSPFGVTQGISLEKGQFSKEQVDALFKIAAEAGIRWWRVWVHWGAIEKTEGQYYWDNLDAIMDSCEKYGIQPYFCLNGGSAPWQTAIKPPKRLSDGNYPPLDAWKKHLKTVAERYKGRLHACMIWNEPDTENLFPFSAKAYFDLLKASNEALKEVDPSMQVGLGGFLCAFGNFKDSAEDGPWWGFNSFYKCKPQPYFDIVDIHLYADDSPTLSWEPRVAGLKELTKRLAAEGDGAKPIWNSETDFSSSKKGGNTKGGGYGFGANTVTEQVQADRIVQWHVQSLAFGVQRNFWYIVAHESHGLVNSDFSPKPAFVAQAAIAEALKDASFAEELELGANLRGYRFKRADGGEKLFAWTVNGATPVSVALKKGGFNFFGLFKPRFAVADVFGNEKRLAAGGEAVMETIDESPKCFVSSSGEIELKSLVDIAFKGRMNVKGAKAPLTVVLRNPSDKPCEVKVKAASKIDLAEGKASLKPGEKAELELSAALDESGVVDCRVEFDGGVKRAVDCSAKCVARKALDLSSGEAEAVLDDDSRCVVGGLSLDANGRPMNVCAREGSADCSAKLFAKQEGRTLKLRVEVVDNDVVPAPASEGPWTRDCVELFFDFQPSKNEFGKRISQLAVAPDGRAVDCKKNMPSGLKTSASRTEKGYVVECSFEIPEDAEPAIGFDFGVDDADGVAKRKLQMMWSGTPDNCGSSDNYGALLLKTPAVSKQAPARN